MIIYIRKKIIVMSAIILYDKLKPMIEKNQRQLTHLAEKEYKDIQFNKTTSMNKNYMFNDSISNNFYHTLGISKEGLRQLISQHVKSTNNFDSLDPNNLMLIFIIRYALSHNLHKLAEMTYEIFVYKIFYPVFTNYFKYGIDENAFEYFKSTLSLKFEISKEENIYAVIDNIGKRNFIKYKNSFTSNTEKDLLLLPVNLKTRINQVIKNIMSAYTKYLNTNKVYVNASRDIENEDGDIFNDQTSNNNNKLVEYKNRLKLFLIHNDIHENLLVALSKSCEKITLNDIQYLYKNVIKNPEYKDKLIDHFVENLNPEYEINDIKILSKIIPETEKYKPDLFMQEIDKILYRVIPNLNTLPKKDLTERRKALIFILFLILSRSKD